MNSANTSRFLHLWARISLIVKTHLFLAASNAIILQTPNAPKKIDLYKQSTSMTISYITSSDKIRYSLLVRPYLSTPRFLSIQLYQLRQTTSATPAKVKSRPCLRRAEVVKLRAPLGLVLPYATRLLWPPPFSRNPALGGATSTLKLPKLKCCSANSEKKPSKNIYLYYRESYSMDTLTHFLCFSIIAFLHYWVRNFTSFENLRTFCDYN